MDNLGVLPAGSLGVGLANTDAEVQAVQSLRYQVFYEEMGATPTAEMALRGQDFDVFDPVADHLLVVDYDLDPPHGRVVGCYRMLRREPMTRIGRFYSASEYDISPVLDFSGNIMELGRSCVAPTHRNRATMQMLWRGLAAYVRRHDVSLLFGCASLYGTDPTVLAPQLSYLYHRHLAPGELRVRALPELHQPMDLLPPEDLDSRSVLVSLPPLIKGYLNVGGFFGDGAVIDRQFNTTDVFVIVALDRLEKKYRRHFF